MTSRRFASASLTFAVLVACGGGASDDAGIARGRGLKPAGLEPGAEAAVYAAAVRASFDPSPDLVLMLHPRRLPRSAGMAGGDSVPAPLVAALRRSGVVAGTCDPRHDMPRDTPHCGSPQAGYVIRATSALRMPGDTVEVYFAAEAFGPEHGPRSVAIRFEKIYQLVGHGTEWRVAREARVRPE